jgi:hypothetical protein
LLAAALTLVAPDFGSPSIDPGNLQGSFVLGYRVDLPVKDKRFEKENKVVFWVRID